ESIVLIRNTDNTISAFLNRCPHRGSLVVRRRQGSVRQLQCSYHGWTFSLEGKLVGLPMPEGYQGTPVEQGAANYSMLPLPSLQSYRGFYFGSLFKQDRSLKDFLGPVSDSIDNMIERSP